jgi:7,8-dihydroneopterin aldolase/epimerase/oxygenase
MSDESGQADVTVEVRGLSIYTYHGVSEAEREVGQRLVIDVWLRPASCEAVTTDRLEDTADYGAVASLAAEVARAESRLTLERVAAEIGERLVERFDAAGVVVRASKPEPPLELPVGATAVRVALGAPVPGAGP